MSDEPQDVLTPYEAPRAKSELQKGQKRAWQTTLQGQSKAERDFLAWIATPEGQYVEREIVKLARLDKSAGDRRGEMKWYFGSVRRTARGLRKDPAGFALNNSYTSLMARRIMSTHYDLAGFFETRLLKGRP